MSIQLDDVVARYLVLRDEIARIDGEAKALKEDMLKLEAYILARAEAEGVEGFKTEAGTATVVTTQYTGIADWSVTLPWIIQHEAWDFVYKNVVKSAVLAYLNQHKELPPGINYTTKRGIQVRRPTN